MRKVSIDELRDRAFDLVRDAEGGEVIVIERNGEAVAELRRPEKRARLLPPLPDLTDLWEALPELDTDSGKFLEEDR